MQLKTDTNYSEFCLIADKRRTLSDDFERVGRYFSKEFNIPLRSLSEKKFFTGKEFRSVGLYTGLAVFQGIFTKEEYNHFLTLHVAYRILNNEKYVLDDGMLDYAEELLRAYVIDFSKIYARCFVSYNVHALIHLVHYVQHYRKTVLKFSAYAFEKFNGTLKPLVKSTNNLPAQVGRRLHEATLVNLKLPNQRAWGQPNRIRLFDKVRRRSMVFNKCHTGKYFFDCKTRKNRFCEIEEAEILVVTSFTYHDSVPYVRGVLLKNCTELQDFYSILCLSLIHISEPTRPY